MITLLFMDTCAESTNGVKQLMYEYFVFQEFLNGNVLNGGHGDTKQYNRASLR